MLNSRPKYLDPQTDFGFKRLLTTDTNKDLLIGFLNEVLSGERRIADIVYNQNEWRGSAAHKKRVIFDLLCTDENGGQFLVEMQRLAQPSFKSRVLYYASMLITEQLQPGRKRVDEYVLLPLHFIAIMGFKIAEMEEQCIENVGLCSTRSGVIFDKGLRFTYICLPNFRKEEGQLSSKLDHWLYIFKHLATLQHQPDAISDPLFNKLFKIAEYNQLTAEEKLMYDQDLKIERATRNAEYGIREEGKLEGILEGKLAARVEIATELLKLKLSLSQVSAVSGVSIEDLNRMVER
ncbi:MAG: Rpn family recombination-promoting nuclease/putative transposase [Pedobacter sp.]|nr:MAG: Rpn family recombination-promoting nuclease/putative transposase [Pedobacter sp.]